MSLKVTIVGAGRAGGAFAAALRAREVDVSVLHHTATIRADGSDLVLLCVPDDHIRSTAARIEPGPAVVGHCAGSRTLTELALHDRRCSVHPLISLPDAATGAERLLDNCQFAVAGDAIAETVVELLGGHHFTVADEQRTKYHATASIAANHLVALCAQVEELADGLGIDPAAFWTLMRTTLDNVAATGATSALTGPAARGDWGTLRAHLEALDPAQSELYRPLAIAAARLAGRTPPDDL